MRQSLSREEFRKKDSLAFGKSLAEVKRTSEEYLPTEGVMRGQARACTKFVSLASSSKSKHASGIVRVPPATDLDFLSDKEKGAARLIARAGNKAQSDTFRGLYGFTRKEAALAELLLQGKSIAEAATKLCISTRTARMHLKRILMKAVIHPRTGIAV